MERGILEGPEDEILIGSMLQDFIAFPEICPLEEDRIERCALADKYEDLYDVNAKLEDKIKENEISFEKLKKNIVEAICEESGLKPDKTELMVINTFGITPKLISEIKENFCIENHTKIREFVFKFLDEIDVTPKVIKEEK